MARSASSGIKAYWRQVRAVQSLTGASSAVARRTVATLRSERGYRTAAETKRHPIIVSRAAEKAVEPPKRGGGGRKRPPPEPPPGEPPIRPKRYRDLDDWIDTWNGWEGEYDEYDIETNADY